MTWMNKVQWQPSEAELCLYVLAVDQEWLDAVNAERKHDQLDKVSYEAFEIIMDKLEKEWFDLVRDGISYHTYHMVN